MLAIERGKLLMSSSNDDVLFESRAVYLCRTGGLRLRKDKMEVVNRDGNITEEFLLDDMRDIRKRGHTCIVWNYGDNSFESHIAILDFQRENWLDALEKAKAGKYDEIAYA